MMLRTCGLYKCMRRIGEEVLVMMMIVVVSTLGAGFSVEGLEGDMGVRLRAPEGLVRAGVLKVHVLVMKKGDWVLLGGPCSPFPTLAPCTGRDAETEGKQKNTGLLLG